MHQCHDFSSVLATRNNQIMAGIKGGGALGWKLFTGSGTSTSYHTHCINIFVVNLVLYHGKLGHLEDIILLLEVMGSCGRIGLW